MNSNLSSASLKGALILLIKIIKKGEKILLIIRLTEINDYMLGRRRTFAAQPICKSIKLSG